MPIIPCPNSSPCIDPANPVSNFSTEAPDPNTFFSLTWPFINPDNPVGGGPGGPGGGPNTPPNTWSADGCGTVCTSTISQEDANLCASRNALDCGFQGNGPRNCNDPQTAFVVCPDGNPFGFTVGACIITAQTVAGANAQAQALAQEQAATNMICLGDFAHEVCVNTPYSTTVSVTKGNGPFTMGIQGGLPPGITFKQIDSQTAMLSGTPPVAGVYSFNMFATDKAGNSMVKPINICVIDLGPATLGSGTVGTSYGQQLMATNCASAPFSWQVTSGALPDGLTLDESSGIISGKPTKAGTFNFTVTLQTGAT